MSLVADYVVVGAGSSGAVLANRLSADPRNTVVLLEAGPEDKNKFAHIPAAFSKLFRSEVDWDYDSEPQPELKGRSIFWPRGKMLGGSSSMNAMMWVRGFAADYDEWASLSDSSWSFEKIVPYFRKIESIEGTTALDAGTTGPLIVSHQRSPRALTAKFLEAVEQAGYPVEPPNLPEPKGFSQTMVNQKRGARWSTADAYLAPIRKRKNLTVLTEAQATRIVFDGSAAVGVEYVSGGHTQTVRAAREVVLAGGAINSPHLLMLSGIGDRTVLQNLGITVQHHAPEVGRNLTDHLAALIGWSVDSDSLFFAEKIPELLNYLIRRRGMLTSNVAEAYGFIKSRDDLALPDVELIYAPAPFFDEGLIAPDAHAAVIGSVLLRPRSRGEITLRTADPLAKPIIDPRYLSDGDGADRAAMLEGLRVCNEIASQPALTGLLGDIVRPRDAGDLLSEALEQNAHTLYHPTSTCRMGNDTSSVVTPDLRVRGVANLRVADASIMPTIIRGHTHAPSVVIGEKASDMILRG
ncbi:MULTISPECIES: GMC family oxidoreductase [Nocardiaceae]|uniref:GMC family oxidoreductase n=1 Tax=Nocardiaceae TaxID=85025 RepID=UPI000522F73B|nr:MULTISPECIES: GMC family oxidoreductase N-terminal domain-containing protein [Rhodococcus]OZC60386.1 glucose-methanol-choline oxidoreductase [Rhodococcus sp. 06-621-2]OZD17688.1 glucose-methanol-choline oxidoreductase [Rhodococcus sp. 06-156-4C]OZD20278.1 glucose-methanol-choline oxidoreductase [Rhodococcus sp. 06-156-3C]OZD21512.1 glucose-methanol-choline oxidoreductase [Rhodococcus sp. 06-156-4a]OZD33284.1 glucose-methanol-choline oxidoreductase [Rhodococcus sp. 06-156-3b]